MKKFVSFALMLALVFTCAVSTVSADTAETTVFEPVYSAENWDFGTSTKVEFSEKTVKFTDSATAKYKSAVMTGDFIMSARIYNQYSSSTNKVIMTVAGTAFKFGGDGTIFLNNDEDATVTSDAKRKQQAFDITVTYDSKGVLKLFATNSAGSSEPLITLKGEDYANKNADGNFSLQTLWTVGSVSNIKFYKPLTETYLNTFDEENPLSDFEVVGGTFAAYIPTDAQDTNHVLTAQGDCHHAWINKYTIGSFSMSFNYESRTSNSRYFIFNATSSNNVYAFAIEGNTTIKIAKGNVSDCNFTSTADLAKATYTDQKVIDILGKLNNFGEIIKIRIDYNAEQGGIYVYLNGKSQPVLSVVDDAHKDKVGRFGIILRWQENQTYIDNLKIEPSLPGFNVSVPTVTINTETNTVTGSAKVTNTTGSAKDAVVILAIYDKDKNLVEVKTAALANTMTACRDFELKAECTSWGDGKTAKCFVFDSLDTVAPLTNAVSYPEN